MDLPIYQVDAFTNRLFGGNPAAVCPLDHWLPDAQMQSIALENNLSETAFFVCEAGGAYRIRWFTPAVEIDLCGHATLASAYVFFQCLGNAGDEVRFASKSGELVVRRQGERLVLDFPARAPERVPVHERLIESLGTMPVEVLGSRDYFVVLASEELVRTVQPNFELMRQLDKSAVIVTAPGEKVDFVSRFFAPLFGVDEDPVTGSAHCTLIPYWSRRLGKQDLHALQVSKRGGELWCSHQADRVHIGGECRLYMEGRIRVE